jgi:murein DD-endopeptidase MepM/ murein hydrolase activator NlpD
MVEGRAGAAALALVAIAAVAAAASPGTQRLAASSPASTVSPSSSSSSSPSSPPSPSPSAGTVPADPAADAALRAWLAHHLEDQQTAVSAAARTVEDKLAAARALQAQRARVAYRVLRHRAVRAPASFAAAPAASSALATPGAASTVAPPAAPVPSAEQAAVRSRAAVKWLLARDRDEVALLADEREQLAASRERLTAAALALGAAALPPRQLPWPAPGTVARGFGPFVHDRSGATLSRRGLDLEVAEHAVAGAVAAGTVVYAGPVRGLDQAVLLDHGSYWSLIGKLSAIDVAEGEAVSARQPLGRAARRRLYLELRLKLLPAGIPVDPAPFLAEP